MTSPAKKFPEQDEDSPIDETPALHLVEPLPLSTQHWMSWESNKFISAPSIRFFQWTVISIAALAVLCLLLSSFIKLDVAVESMGEITPAAPIHEVFSQMDGYVSSVDRGVGDVVRQGDVIAHLMTGDLNEDSLKKLKGDLEILIEKIESSGSSFLTDGKLSVIPAFRSSDATLTKSYAALEQAQRNLVEQANAQKIDQAKELYPLIERKKILENTLFQMRHSTKKRFMQYYVENTADEIRKISGQVAIVQAQYHARANQALSDFLRELRLTSNEISVFLDSHLIKSPLRGKIVRELISQGSRTVPGTSIGAMIPEGTGLVTKMRVRPQDIVWIKVGQKVFYKVDSYPFERYGLFEGEVLSVSALRDDQTKQDSSFSVTASISLPPTLSEERKKEINLVMGLELNGKIIRGRETILDLILDHIYPARTHSAQ
jgi:multidrug resistance efflux pump